MTLAALLAVLLAAPARAAFYAAAGKADVTPDPAKETVWLAGYGAHGRRAQGVHDPLMARALVVSDGKTTVGFLAVDSIGLYRKDIEEIRRRSGLDGPHKFLFVGSTHDHSSPDTLGLWGRFLGVSGVEPEEHERLLKNSADLVRETAGRLQEASLVAGRADPFPGHLCRDSRDPVVIDPELDALQVKARAGGTIGTLVRYSCHAEVLPPKNMLITADYPGALCARVEAKEGGTCVFFQGTIGGLMTPDVDVSGPLPSDYKEMERVGDTLADDAVKALAEGTRIASPEVSFSSRTILLPVENSRYLLFLHALTFGHTLRDAEGDPLPWWKAWTLTLRHLVFFPLPERLRPWVDSEVSLVRLGPVKVLGIPGELFPELAIGGYDGSRRYGRPLVSPTNPNPPKLSEAPKPPYLRELMRARYGIIVGLAGDEVGYIIPRYDFQAAPTRSMLPKPKGTHYEETNSIGPRAAGIIVGAAEDLLKGG
ncbi:MAG: hypothetical protein KGL53_04355 [Elusimicrobia bacterium]|nr:hypothetical protein [Elusimicrobiota bacterium]